MRTSGLRLFLDSADVSTWKQWLPTGLFYGVTSNPLLLKQAQIRCTTETLHSLAEQAFELGAEEVQVQTWGRTTEELTHHGEALARSGDRVVVKIPVTLSGVAAAKQLKQSNVRITLTAAYTHHQAIIADAACADYIAPYLGRITDLGIDGRQEMINMHRTLAALRSSTRILVASIRSVHDISALTTHGLDTFTLSPAIAHALFDVPATEKAASDFDDAAQCTK